MRMPMGTLAIDLSNEERSFLIELLKCSLSETRVEVRRSEVDSFRRGVKREEALLRSLIERLETPDAA